MPLNQFFDFSIIAIMCIEIHYMLRLDSKALLGYKDIAIFRSKFVWYFKHLKNSQKLNGD